ncbi:hypothetical protein KA005_32615 [bacterium]|nr:hypothetical protein [bacterium]
MTTKEGLWTAVREILESSNDYLQTVHSILAFGAFVVHDGISRRPNARFGFGRRMHTSPDNLQTPSSEITPDLVAQKSKQYGIVAEAKKSLDKNRSNWTQHVERLRKYDDDLGGWWTGDEKITNFNAVMLIHQSRGRLFRDFLESCKNEDPNSVGPNTCVVEFNESPELDPFYFFRLEFGDIQDTELKKNLYEGTQVPLVSVQMSFGNIKYYDAEPPMVNLLTDLWTDSFPSRLDDAEFDEQRRSKIIRVKISDVTEELQRGYGSQALYVDDRSGEFPRQKWIRNAFDRLISYGLASHDDSTDEYTIFFKPFSRDVKIRFAEYEIKKGKGEKAETPLKQLRMFPNLRKGEPG